MRAMLVILIGVTSFGALAETCPIKGKDGKCYLFQLEEKLSKRYPKHKEPGEEAAGESATGSEPECNTLRIRVKNRAEEWAHVACVNGKRGLLIEQSDCLKGVNDQGNQMLVEVADNIGCRDGVNQAGICTLLAERTVKCTLKKGSDNLMLGKMTGKLCTTLAEKKNQQAAASHKANPGQSPAPYRPLADPLEYCEIDKRTFQAAKHESCESAKEVLEYCTKNSDIVHSYQPGDSIHEKQERTFTEAPARTTGP